MTGDLLGLIQRSVEDPSAQGPGAQGIARTIGALITAGSIGPGDCLPTVRSVAQALGVSSSTVSTAWRLMQDHGLIQTDRRRGTTVRSSRGSIDGRYWQVPVPAGTLDLDLSTGTPDPTLLPDLGAILNRIHTDVAVSSYVDAPVLPALEAELRRRWPFEPAHLTVVDGAQDALDRLVAAIIRIGDTVIVEQPTFPPLLDMLEIAGASVIGVPLDSDGLQLGALAEAAAASPTALIMQPRAHNPSGVSTTPERAAAISDLLGPEVWVIEDDHSGDVAGVDLASVSAHRPGRSLFIRSFSKSHGPDLRIAAVGGAAGPLRTLERRRSLGPSWTSRLVQRLLLEMLTDPLIEADIARAGETYRRRHETLVEALATHGVDAPAGTGLNLTVTVRDEQTAVVFLAANGIGVAPGRPFVAEQPSTRPDFIRLSIGNLPDDVDGLAATVAEAAGR